ncbi:MAG: sulfotransferase [Alphaproteobacteria bacterium]|nr:sulfotransferase [Alphaproteobacteria bacterium]
MARLPTFLIIGAARSGTTALYDYLKQHPGIYMTPRKETNFFAFEGETLACKGPGADYINNSMTSLAEYEALFEAAPEGAARGEACPLYLYAEKAPARIHRRVPDARLVAILRNPIEQAYSHYLYAKRQTIEPAEDFVKALTLEEERLKAGWQPLFGYSRFPRYFEQLSRYTALFPRDQLKLFLYEDFDAKPLDVLAELFRFVGVDDGFAPDVSHRPNAGGTPKNQRFQDFLMKPNPLTRIAAAVIPYDLRRRIRDALAARNMERDDMPAEARARLVAALRDDVLRLQDLVGRDLISWLS